LHEAPYLLILVFHGAFGVDSLLAVLHHMNVDNVAGVVMHMLLPSACTSKMLAALPSHGVETQE
jgi:hypothetical protein